ncbi:MAG TPA: glycosyltransferase family 2 protein [Xenococcaceae cyanobacterium]|jgi:glycosyltransferase involved in cell wall biosynthesis
MTTISVIIPAYNAERTILATIKSVQQQTFKDLEIIVIDDGSSDRTREILATIDDERLKINSYSNQGLSTARNRGIARAKGKYLSFIDADDLWTPDKLAKQLTALKSNPQASVAYSWMVLMVEATDNHEQTSFISGKKVAFTGNVYEKLLLDNFIGNGSNILVKQGAIASVGEFDTTLKSCEDWDYYLRLAAKYNFALVPEHQIIYRKTPGTMTSKGSILETEGLKVIDKAYQTIPQKLQHLKNQSIARFSLVCGRIYLDRNCDRRDISKAQQRLFKAIKLNPRVLFLPDTYTLLFKITFKKLLPYKLVNSLISTLKKPWEIQKFKSIHK